MSVALTAAARLERALRAENAALARPDLQSLPALAAEKAAAAEALAAAGAAPRTAEAEALAAGLRVLAEENRQLLERAIEVQGRVLRLLAAAARQAGRAEARRYGAAGQPRPDSGAVLIAAQA